MSLTDLIRKSLYSSYGRANDWTVMLSLLCLPIQGKFTNYLFLFSCCRRNPRSSSTSERNEQIKQSCSLIQVCQKGGWNSLHILNHNNCVCQLFIIYAPSTLLLTLYMYAMIMIIIQFFFLSCSPCFVFYSCVCHLLCMPLSDAI